MRRLHALDALRGIAALSVVVWHWQHFFAIGNGFPPGPERTLQPFFGLLRPFYDQGWAAVDIFFCLSGFIFCRLYGDAIRTGRIGAGAFALLRFSRLYPLHVVTLLAVALLQGVYHRLTGRFFIYDHNTWREFASQLVMAQSWWPDAPQSFNGPSWSVSVEILLYTVFFVACRAGARGGWQMLAFACAGLALLNIDAHIARGLMGFFMGGVAFHVGEAVKRHTDAAEIAKVIFLSAAAGWIVLFFDLYRGAAWLSGGETNALFLVVFIFILCPLTALALSLHEEVLGGRYRRLSPLGDISYSVYLLHVPLQLVLAIAASYFAIPPALFQTSAAMVLFFAALIGLSTLSHAYVERPVMMRIRNARLPRRVLLQRGEEM